MTADNFDDEAPIGAETLTRRRLLEVGAGAGAAAAFAGPLASLAQAAASPKRGGKLRVGMVGGGNAETLDPQNALAEIDVARSFILYENLFDYDPTGKVYNRLAADYSANKTATVWKIKVRPGVVFHDGSPLTAADVVYSLRRITDPKNKLPGAADLPSVQPAHIRALDKSTVQITLTAPTGDLRGGLAQRTIKIVKAGMTDFTKPNGTGAFKFQSWTRGKRSLFVRHDAYREHGGAYLDSVEIISISDENARLAALAGGQIDALQALNPTFVKTVQKNSKLRVLEAHTGQFTPQTMSCTMPPFNDVRVRQAFRLLVDREQIIRNALLGHGKLGNDLFCPFDENYASSLPQRKHDPEQAKALLKKAGKEGLTVSLYTSDAAIAMLESSTLIAEQAKQAGVTIKLDKVPSDQYFTLKYLKTPFACSGWGQRSLEAQILQSVYSKAPYNETDWRVPKFDRITAEARRTLDPKRRKELYFEAQKMLYDRGGFIIWGFPNQLDAYSAKLKGLKPSTSRALGFYQFQNVYFA